MKYYKLSPYGVEEYLHDVEEQNASADILRDYINSGKASRLFMLKLIDTQPDKVAYSLRMIGTDDEKMSYLFDTIGYHPNKYYW